MGLESGTYISDLNVNNPVHATDQVGEADDHIRLIKSCLLNTFPLVTGAVNLSHTQINDLPQKPNQNTFTNTGTRRNAPIVIEGANPNFAMYETDAAVNEKGWDWLADGGALALRTHTDAGTAGSEPLAFVRSGTAITDIQCQAESVELLSGTDLHIYDSTNADYIQFGHDGTKAQIITNNGNIEITAANGAANVELHTGTPLVLQDAANTDTCDLRMTSAAFFIESTEHIALEPGALHEVYVYRAGENAKFVVYNDDASEFIRMYHDSAAGWVDASDAIILTIEGETAFEAYHNNYAALRYDNTQTFRTADHDAAGVTSGAEVLCHDGQWRDVGLNLLPQFNFNASDTLEAGHCGAENRKTNSTARTLTLAASTDLDFPIDGVTHISNEFSSGDYTISEGTGTTLYVRVPGVGRVDAAGSATVGPGGFATIKRLTADEYHMWGSEITP